MADETDLERTTRVKAWEDNNKTKPKKTEIKNDNDLTIQTEEISDDGRIVITKTNPNGL